MVSLRTTDRSTLVVAGTGMAGAKVVEEIHRRAPDRFHIRMFGAEPHGTYNRILLSSVLAGRADPAQLWLNPLEWYEERGIHVHSGVKVDSIDRGQRVVTGGGGKVVEPFDVLILATGSRPFVPPIDGVKRRGVFVFRTLEDCATIGAYAQECDRAVVLGGGLLGLEAASGLLTHGLEVTVVEMAPHLMSQQLDPVAAGLLKRKLEALGVRFLLSTKTTKLLGVSRNDSERETASDPVAGVQFADGSVLETDMVVVSCGIRPNVEEARAAGLLVERAIVVDDQLRSNDEHIFAVGECAQHRGQVYGLVDPVYDQSRVLAGLLCETEPGACYEGTKLATTLKVMGVDLTSMGDVQAAGSDCEVVSHHDPTEGIYKKLVLRDRKLVGAILLGVQDQNGKFKRLFKQGTILSQSPLDLLTGAPGPDLEADVLSLPDEAEICNCHAVPKGRITQAIKAGKCTIEAIGACVKAGTGCGSCQPLLQNLIDAVYVSRNDKPAANKIEIIKAEKDGLDSWEDIEPLVPNNRWAEMSEATQQRAKWLGLFFRKPTPGNFMLRLRLNAGQTNARQLRVIADLSDEFGKGFCDLTTRQQIQLRWFTLGDVPEIWRRLEDVGLHSKQTGMDSVRGVCGCPVAGLTPHESLNATPVVRQFADMIVDNREFSNLPRKFNVTITGCLENCCQTETQDIALIPAFRDLDGAQVNGFNVLVGGKQGSGGYRPGTPLDVFVRAEEAAQLCADITRVFRDHGSRATRNRSRLAFLIGDRGVGWFRMEVEKLWQQSSGTAFPGRPDGLGRPSHSPLLRAGTDLRKKHHVDHLGIHPQKKNVETGLTPHYLGMLVPVGRMSTSQMRSVADLADRYGNGDVRTSAGQNLIIPNIPEDRIGAITEEPIFHELPFNPSPIMRGLVACTGTDYCGLALIETKGYAIEVARELERRTQGKKVLPMTMHWSGCPAGCGLHQVATIGLQGCRSRVAGGEIVDAAHVCVSGKAGPEPKLATDLMYDVPISKLADALEPLVCYLPRE